MIIEQSGVQLFLKSYVCQTTRRRKHDFRLKLHSAQFNYHFITSIWKLHNFFKAKFWELKLQNSPHNGFLCISYSCNFIGYFKQALKSDSLFFYYFLFFNVLFSLAGEKERFSLKNFQFCNS